jgi:hypothetical protein
MMHDGISRNGFYYWTTVNGKITVADANSLTITEQIDLKSIYANDEPGWCRGLEIIDNLAFVGFTRFRKPSKSEFLKFAIRGRKILNTHVLCYDLKAHRVIEDWFLPHEDTVIYGIYRYPTNLEKK